VFQQIEQLGSLGGAMENCFAVGAGAEGVSAFELMSLGRFFDGPTNFFMFD
jgi:hypothetical protein